MNIWIEYALQIILLALGILAFQLLVIILGARYGLFLWIFKQLFKRRGAKQPVKEKN